MKRPAQEHNDAPRLGKAAWLWLVSMCASAALSYGGTAHGQPAPGPRQGDRPRTEAPAEREASGLAQLIPSTGPLGPLLRAELGSRVSGRQVRVPVAADGAPHDQTADKLVVVAGIANLAKTRDGSAFLEQAKSGTSVLSSVDAKLIARTSRLTTDAKTSLPWLVVDSQERNHQNLIRSARPFLKLARAIQWDRIRQLHIAEFLVGLDAETGEAGALSEPLEASLSVSCDDVTPHSIKFTTIGPAGDQLVRVACSAQVKNDRESQVLSVRLESGSLDYPFTIPRRPGPFQLSASSSSVLGLGLGELTFTAVSAEEDGTPLPAAAQTRVPLHVDDGELDPDSLLIGQGAAEGSASIHVRGSGSLQVRAGIAERESEPVTLKVRWPLLLSCMAPVGGAIGGYLALALQRKRQKSARRRGQRAAACVEGALVGIVVVLALTLLPSFGIMPDWARTAEIAWFVVAVFAGFLGLELLDRLARLFFKQSPEHPEREAMKPAAAGDRE